RNTGGGIVAFVTRRGQRWRARYRGPDGRERSQSFDRKLDAERWLAIATADVVRGQWVDPALGRMSFASWARRWEAGLVGLRPSTRALNVRVLHGHLLPRFGSTPLGRITHADVSAMVADDLAEGLSASATRRHVFVLRQVLEAAKTDGRLARNVARDVKLPAERSRPMRTLMPGQVAQLADTVRPVHYRPLILTAAYVGLRFGELVGLRVGKVDVLRRTVLVDTQLVEVDGALSWGPPKSSAGTRTVTMPATVAELLGAHMGTDPVRESGLVFPTVTGRPLRRTHWAKTWRRAVGECFDGTDLASLTFHELRHTAASLAIAVGAHPAVIRDRLGHSSITTTIDTYGHLFPSLDEALAEGLDGLLRESLAATVRPVDGQTVRFRRSEG
ncbi:MAG: site-specific integrase, partial [Actinobacteria bacterium]|nr:site-specific integrase [Actinomycetota bacterium]